MYDIKALTKKKGCIECYDWDRIMEKVMIFVPLFLVYYVIKPVSDWFS